MASHSRCGLSPHQREVFLREMGYKPERGKDHVVWINAKMKARGADAPSMPENFRSNTEQKAWEITLPCDPGHNLWGKLVKQVTWCNNALNGVTCASAGVDFNSSAEDKDAARGFRLAREEYCAVKTWQKAMKDMVIGRKTEYPGERPAVAARKIV